MTVIFRVIKRKVKPSDPTSKERYYPKVVHMARKADLRFIVDRICDVSSLSRGDVRSVLQNFVEKLKEQLLEGKIVSIEGLGTFSLSIRNKGEDNLKDMTAGKIKDLHICFLADKELKINRMSTRAGERLRLISMDDYLKEIDPKDGGGTPPKPDDGKGEGDNPLLG